MNENLNKDVLLSFIQLSNTGTVTPVIYAFPTVFWYPCALVTQTHILLSEKKKSSISERTNYIYNIVRNKYFEPKDLTKHFTKLYS